MEQQLFLVAPADMDAQTFRPLLDAALEAAPVSALYLPRGERDDAAYREFCAAVISPAQAHDCAVLIDNDGDLAKSLGADGAHVSLGIGGFKQTLGLLKPDMIVGAGAVHSRHDAMTKAEEGADYIFFGDVIAPATIADIDSALWWAETFEVPAVVFEVSADKLAGSAIEFAAYGPSIWTAPEGPAKAIAARTGILAATP